LDGVVRPSAASINIPDSGRVGREVVDSVSVEKLQEAIDQHRRIASRPGLRLIVRGRLNTVDEPLSYIDKNGKRKRTGFGHLNVFPAQIELVSVQLVDKFEGDEGH